MLTSVYVIDYILFDLEEAKETYDRVFATEPLWINPDMAPGTSVNAMYYQMPGPVGHVTTIGFFENNDDIQIEKEGAKLLGIQCSHIHQTIGEMEQRGVKFLTKEPKSYAVGVNIETIEYNGLAFSISEHHPGGHEKARRMMFTRAGSNDYGDASQGGMLDRVHLVSVAVNNLDEAVSNFRSVLGVEPTESCRGTVNPDLDVVYFPAPGNGTGLQSIALVAAKTESPLTEEGKLVSSFLKQYGEGIYLIGMLVSDAVAAKEVMSDRGLTISSADMSVAEHLAQGFALDRLHNVTLWFGDQRR